MVCAADPDVNRPEPLAAEPAKGKVFLQNRQRLYAYVLTLLPNRADADNVLQEASLVMWDKFDECEPPNDFTAWRCRIAYFKVLDFRKRSQRQRVRFSQAMLERVAETAAEHTATLELDDRRKVLPLARRGCNSGIGAPSSV
jgi:RNA polymerase sigma-70 factor (ECF subfamily)